MHQMKYTINTIMIFALLLAGGCATGLKMKSISPGMQQAQVIEILGRPDGFTVNENHHVLKYTNRLISDWSSDRADFYVVLVDNKVVQCESGNVRRFNGAALNNTMMQINQQNLQRQQMRQQNQIQTLQIIGQGQAQRSQSFQPQQQGPSMAPDGSYVVGKPSMAPDGSYVGGNPILAPDGTFVGDGSK